MRYPVHGLGDRRPTELEYAPPIRNSTLMPYGAVAQLGERRVRNAKVGSSILLRSTITTSFISTT